MTSGRGQCLGNTADWGLFMKWIRPEKITPKNKTYCCTLLASHMRIALLKFRSLCCASLSANSGGIVKPSFLQIF